MHKFRARYFWHIDTVYTQLGLFVSFPQGNSYCSITYRNCPVMSPDGTVGGSVFLPSPPGVKAFTVHPTTPGSGKTHS